MIFKLNIFRFSFIIFLLFYIEVISQDSFSNNLNPNTLTLLNKDVIMVAKDGIHFYDSTFTIENTDKKILLSSQISTSTEYAKTAMAQFSESDDEYIIIFILNEIYIFDKLYNKLFSENITQYINSDYYYLIPHKNDNNCLYFIISCRNKEVKNFTLNYFSYDIGSSSFSNIMIKALNVSTQLYHSTRPQNFAGPSCLFLNPTSLNKEILACFYSTSYPAEIHSRVFDPNNNFEEMTQYFSYYSEDASFEFPNYISALADERKQKALIYFANTFSYYITFDLNNLLSRAIKISGNGDCNRNSNFDKNKFAYFKEVEEFVAVSGVYDCGVKVALITFDSDFNLKEKGYFEAPFDVYRMNYYSPYVKDGEVSMVYDNGQNLIRQGGNANLEPAEPSNPPVTPTEAQTTSPTPIKNTKCKSETLESSNYDLCTECSNERGYFSAQFSDNSALHGFLECYNSDTKPNNFYFDNSEQIYKQCYKTCKTCNEGGNEIINNCLECENNYIKKPDDPDTTNCVINCKYMYYYNSYGQYKCTNGNLCPDEAKIYIEPLNKCTGDCSKENIYKNKYGGKCLENCPENTHPNENNICIDENLNSCSKTDNKMEKKQILDLNEININSKNYAEEFSYTTKHVSHFFNNLYSILIYKDLKCIEELSLDMPKVDFGSCFNKVIQNLDPPTNDNIIIALIEKLTFKKKLTTFLFYHPITGEKIDIGTICSDEQVTVKESVLYQLNNSNIDLESALFLVKQGIDIFNISHEFYNDICYIFDSPNGKDITLKDRILTYYPNITLCDDGCIGNGVDLNSMESICECKFNNLINNDILNNQILGEALGGITDFISSSNIFVLKCFKQVFIIKQILKNVGSYIIIGITLIEIVCSILFFSLSMIKVFRYIYKLTELYKKYIKHKNKNSSKNVNKYNKNAPPKKEEKNKKVDFRIKSANLKIKPINYEYTKNVVIPHKSDSSRKINDHHDLIKKDQTNDIKVFNYETEMNEMFTNTNLENSDNNEDINIKEYLKPEFDEMEYDDAIKYDDRKFCEFYWDRLKDKQIIINTFFNKENLKPMTIKIIILLLNIELYFVVNGLFYSEEYISEIFHSNEKETFFSFFKRSLKRFLYTTVVGVIIESIIEFIFLDENRIKRIFKREKDNFVQLKYEIYQFIKNLKKRFIFFIALCFILSIFSWYYVNCFNNVYPGVVIEWVKSSIVILIIMLILPVITGFIETILRALSFKCKSETLFEIKKYFA